MSEQLNKDSFMFGEDIETSYGTVRFLKYKEYIKMQQELNLISMNILHFYWLYKKDSNYNLADDETKASIEGIKDKTLYKFIMESPEFTNVYYSVFKKVLIQHDSLEQIFDTEELFMGLRSLIMDMNVLSEQPVSPNQEIQNYYDERKRIQQKESGEQDVSDVVSSIVVGSPHSFEEVANMTVMQVNLMFSRIAAFKSFDVTTLFATVSSEAKIEQWSKHIDLFSKQELGIGYGQFNKKYKGLFND